MANETGVTAEVRIIYLYTGDVTVGVEMTWVRSVERLDKLTREDNQMGRVGSVEIPGGKAPVYDMATLMGISGQEIKEGSDDTRRIVVMEVDKSPWGLIVDRVSQVSQVPADSVFSMPSVSVREKSDFFKGVILTEGELLLYLSPDKLRPATKSTKGKNRKGKKGSAKASAPVRPSLWEIRSEESKDNPPPATRRRVSKDRRAAYRKSEGEDERRNVEYGQVVLFYFSEPNEKERSLVFGLSMTQVAEVLGEADIVPVPGAESYVMGVVNWQGKPTPVVSLSTMLGLDVSLDVKNTRYIIARDRIGINKGGLLGFPVWEDMRTINLPIESEPASEILQLNYKYIRGVVELKDETLVIPDIGGIIFESQL